MSGLNSLESKVDKLDVDKLKHIPIDLKTISNVVHKEGFKKLKYYTDKQSLDKKVVDVENKMRDVSGLVTNTAFNTKKDKIEKKT